MPLLTEPALTTPGQRTAQGTRQPPSPVGVFLPTEWGGCGIGPGIVVWAVVCGVVDDSVVGDLELIEHFEELTDVHVVFDHATGVFVSTGVLSLDSGHFLSTNVGTEVHAGAAPPDKPWFVGFGLAFDEINRCRNGFIIDGLHPLFSQWPGIFDLAISGGLDDSAWAVFFEESRILWIVFVFLALLLHSDGRDYREIHRSHGWWAAFHHGHPGGFYQIDQ